MAADANRGFEPGRRRTGQVLSILWREQSRTEVKAFVVTDAKVPSVCSNWTPLNALSLQLSLNSSHSHFTLINNISFTPFVAVTKMCQLKTNIANDS